MARRADMNRYTTPQRGQTSQCTEGELAQTAGATAASVGGMVWKAIKTVLWVGLIAGVLVMLSVASYIFSFRNSAPPNIYAMSLSYSSIVYLDHNDGTSEEYLSLYGNENRVWVPLSDIPVYMTTAQIAIEDHRFMEHKGVDWRGTLGAVAGLVGYGNNRGGSTLTQQLIKNITGETQVSIKRKIKEIFTALNLEGGYTDENGVHHAGYSKEEILEAYLNIVNYGGTCQGVEAAANYYFNKSISQCSLAECALIAGITQNPWQYNPMIFPEDSKERAEVVLDRMLELSEGGELVSRLTAPITQSEHDAAVAELESMDFLGVEDTSGEEEDEKQDSWNWYIDLMFEDVVEDLQAKFGYSEAVAVDMMYNAGLEIHSAMDLELQEDVENFFLTTDSLAEDPAVELGFYMIDPYTGRTMAVVGGRYEKQGNRLYDFATDAARPSGSSIKPIGPYSVGIMTREITFGSVLKDEPLPNYPNGGPQNFSRTYEKNMNVDIAIAKSQNAPAAWLCNTVSPESCYDFLTQSLHMTSFTEEDSHSISAMALGGQSWGVKVEEMAAAFSIFANGGVYHKPMTYYYVKDHDGNVILDNRADANPGEQVMTLEQATVMNHLLQCPVYYPQGTLYGFSGYNMTLYGKTGTTDDSKDLWTMLGTPFGVMGLWAGYENPRELWDSRSSARPLQALLDHLLEKYDWSSAPGYTLSDNVVSRTFCRDSGKLAGPKCFSTATGWYELSNVPGTCNGGSDHITGKNTLSPSPSASPSASPSPSPSPSPTVSVAPSITPPPPSESPTPTPPPPTEEPTPPPTEPPTEPPTPTPPPATEEPTPTPTPPPPTDPPQTEPPVESQEDPNVQAADPGEG